MSKEQKKRDLAVESLVNDGVPRDVAEELIRQAREVGRAAAKAAREAEK